MLISYLFQEPILFVAWVFAILVGLSIHEFSHAFVAVKLGDSTPQYAGRVTLNPLAHLDLMGFLMLLFVGFGWGKPVPFNPYNLKNSRWGPAWVALAGPFSNLISIVIFGLIIKVLLTIGIFLPGNLLLQFLAFLILINVILLVFNLIPIPPLDGSKILFSILPAKYNNLKITLEHQGPLLLIGLIILDRFLPYSFLGVFFDWVFNFVGRFI